MHTKVKTYMDIAFAILIINYFVKNLGLDFFTAID